MIVIEFVSTLNFHLRYCWIELLSLYYVPECSFEKIQKMFCISFYMYLMMSGNRVMEKLKKTTEPATYKKFNLCKF